MEYNLYRCPKCERVEILIQGDEKYQWKYCPYDGAKLEISKTNAEKYSFAKDK